MRIVLDAAYLLLCLIGLPYFLFKFLTAERFRAGVRERLGSLEPRPGDRPAIWLHSVSVGEVLAARPLVKALEEELDGWDICISTITNTGQTVARKNFPQHRVFYFPLDLSLVVNRAFEAIRPSVIVLVELEIWPNFLDAARRQDIPVVLVNGRISEKSYRGYRLIRPLLYRSLSKIRRFCVQNEQYADRFRRLGMAPERVLVTGTMKYDNPGVGDPEGVRQRVRKTLRLRPEEEILVAGSTHAPEEQWIIDSWQELRTERPGLRLILAPRHPERVPEVLKWLEERELPYLKRTAIEEIDPTPEEAVDQVLVIDTIGELRSFYSVATVVFIGNSLNPQGGGHNLLEPADDGKAIVFGPNMVSFTNQVEQFLEHRAAVQIDGPEALTPTLRDLFAEPERAEQLGRRALELVEESRGGATRKHLAVITDIVREIEAKRETNSSRPGEQSAAVEA